MGLNLSAKYWMEFFHIYLWLKLKCLFEKTKITEKETREGPFKKTILTNVTSGISIKPFYSIDGLSITLNVPAIDDVTFHALLITKKPMKKDLHIQSHTTPEISAKHISK